VTFRTASTTATVRLAAAGVAVAAVLTGCSFTNPATIATPYAPSDGTASTIDDPATGGVVRLRNFLLVTSEAGAAGVVAGAIANDGTEPVTVSLTVQDATGAPVGQPVDVEVTPGTLAQVGTGGTALTLPTVPTGPGTNLRIKASTGAGSTTFALPVLAADGPYATLTPTATPAG
jgi:hypothetical protein